jgi:hypothetical protein
LLKQQLSAEDIAAGMLQLALKKFDDQANRDVLLGKLHDKKYSGFTSERQMKSKNGLDRGGKHKFFREQNGKKQQSSPRKHIDGATRGVREEFHINSSGSGKPETYRKDDIGRWRDRKVARTRNDAVRNNGGNAHKQDKFDRENKGSLDKKNFDISKIDNKKRLENGRDTFRQEQDFSRKKTEKKEIELDAAYHGAGTCKEE